LHHNNPLSHSSFFTGELLTKNMSFPTHPTHLTWPPVAFLFP
jgi:hypothetical protein